MTTKPSSVVKATEITLGNDNCLSPLERKTLELHDTEFESLDPNDKSRLASAVQAVAQLGTNAGGLTGPAGGSEGSRNPALASLTIMRALINPQLQSLTTFRPNPNTRK